jgi:hypothetical protein
VRLCKGQYFANPWRKSGGQPIKEIGRRRFRELYKWNSKAEKNVDLFKIKRPGEGRTLQNETGD